MAKFKKGDIVYWWGERCEVLAGPKWPVANPQVPAEFADPYPDGKNPGPRHYKYGDKPDRRTTAWRERNPFYLVRRPDGYEQYIHQNGLTKDRRGDQRRKAFLATAVEMYMLLSPSLRREEHAYFLRLSDRDAKMARAYLERKGVPAGDINKAMQLSLKLRQ